MHAAQARRQLAARALLAVGLLAGSGCADLVGGALQLDHCPAQSGAAAG